MPQTEAIVNFVQTALRNHAPTTIRRSAIQPCAPSMFIDPSEIAVTRSSLFLSGPHIGP
jgi:hypothetical protein